MKKILSSIIYFVLIINLFVPFSVFAADPTIKLSMYREDVNASSGLVSWTLDINTTNIPDTKVVSIKLYEGNTQIQIGEGVGNYVTATINKNTGNYSTQYILKPGIQYKVTASYGTVAGVFEKVTLGTVTPDPVKTNATDSFWFRDMDQAFRGQKGTLQLPGFATFSDCEAARKDYWKNNTSNSDNQPCVVISETQVLQNFELEKQKNAKMPGDDSVAITPKINVTENKSRYNFLAPLGSIKCMDSNNTTNPVRADGTRECISSNIGDYLNFIFKFGIGLCAALAVVMLIINGITYMGDESIFGKTEAKKKMIGAIFGLIIILASWIILNTINPDLTGVNGLKIDQAQVTIENFDVSGSSTFDGKPIKINFNKEAYPAAKIASQKTGVDIAFILAMFAQETGSGSNTGKCNYTTANMGTGQLEALKRIASKLNISDISTINMSCSGAVSGDHGGAIGLTQFIPTTWELYAERAKTALGHEPNPWNVGDALMMTAIFLKSNGGDSSNVANQENAACKYFGSCSQTVSCGSGATGTYGQCILGKKVSIQQQIDASIKSGDITA